MSDDLKSHSRYLVDRMKEDFSLYGFVFDYNSSLKNNFFKITITFDNYFFEFTPIDLYITINGLKFQLVCMYNLKMIHSGNEIYTKIPYYISDGRTNKLRSNLLFPFICFNKYYGKDCPINYNFVDGGLIKYHTIIPLVDMTKSEMFYVEIQNEEIMKRPNYKQKKIFKNNQDIMILYTKNNPLKNGNTLFKNNRTRRINND